ILWIALGSNILDMLFCFIYFFVILLVGGWLVVVPFFVSVFFIVFVIFTAYSSESSNEISNSNELYSKIPFISYLKAQGNIDSFISSYMCNTIEFNDKSTKDMLFKNNIASMVSFLSSFQIVAIIIFSFYLVRSNQLTVGAIFATIILSGKIIQSISTLPIAIRSFKELRFLFKFINDTVALSDSDNNEVKKSFFYADNSMWVINKCSVSYTQNKTLNDVSFDIKEGEKIAIVGPSDSGKSTLLGLILGIVSPSQGSVKFRNHSDFYSLWSRCFYSEQKQICNLSLFDYFDGNINKLKKALTFPFMAWVPGTFDNGIYIKPSDSNSNSLTLEKKQCIDLARLFVSEKDFIILDEPATAINTEAEGYFLNHLKDLCTSNKTIIIATNKKG
ncbi:ATP-binding cassette domain-containing protein, partial [Salmonella enterica]|nr:ATP-binding cassette domain-containing protein [Salmonella enterica]